MAISARNAAVVGALLAFVVLGARASRLGALGPIDGLRARDGATRAFDAATWRSGRLDARGAMLADLMRTHRLVDVKHAEVEALLGPTECYADYEDQPCYGLRLGGACYRLTFSVDHSDVERSGVVLEADLDADAIADARCRSSPRV